MIPDRRKTVLATLADRAPLRKLHNIKVFRRVRPSHRAQRRSFTCKPTPSIPPAEQCFAPDQRPWLLLPLRCTRPIRLLPRAAIQPRPAKKLTQASGFLTYRTTGTSSGSSSTAFARLSPTSYAFPQRSRSISFDNCL